MSPFGVRVHTNMLTYNSTVIVCLFIIYSHTMDPPPPGTGVSQPMQGFGSSDMTTPFHYGSVRDGQFKQDSLEHKLKKQYWKTKQTVTQKFGKSQDEFVVAGDTDIDTKLEVR